MLILHTKLYNMSRKHKKDELSIHPEEGTFADDGKGFVKLVDVDFLVYRRKNDNRMV